MFERYTERARRVIFFARYEASQFGSTTIETEHLLLGLIREDRDLADRFLKTPSSIESIRKEIEGRTTIREKVSKSMDLPLSNECKRILAYAYEEADRLAHRNVSTEHLFLGILREERCVAAEALHSRGLRLEEIREELAKSGVAQEQPTGFQSPVSRSPGLELHTGSALLVDTLERHGFTASKDHLYKATVASDQQDWKTAQSELQLFLETVVDAISKEPNGDDAAFPIFEGFDWRLSLQGLRSGLSADEDWKFRWRLTLLLAEVLLKRFEQRLDS